MEATSPSGSKILRGFALMVIAYGVYSIQDALAKWLVRDFSVWQVVFFKGMIISGATICIGGRRTIDDIAKSSNKLALLKRGVVNFLATFFFFLSTRHLGLADATTILFVAPVLVVGMSMTMLQERVSATRWATVAIGLLGAAIAINPTGEIHITSALCALASAFFWALGVVLIKKISSAETIASQMIVSNLVVAGFSGVTLFWTWQSPGYVALILLICVGVTSGFGQYMLYEALRRAPASLLAPVEYTSLLWAFLLGWVVFGDLPGLNVFGGACLIGLSSTYLLVTERRTERLEARARPMNAESEFG